VSLRIVHLSDLHLGFRAWPGTERGRNRRERDVSSAFHRALQEAARLRPDLVLITGDLFHRPDPPSLAYLSLVRGVRSLRSLLPSVPVLAIAGERDTPAAAADPGPMAVLDSLAGVEAAAGAVRAVRLRALGVHALLVPHRAVAEPPLPRVRPDEEARYNILLVRGDPGGEGPGLDVDPDDWDYVAVGGPHRARAWAEHVRAAGSPERIGWDPWSEGTEEKGFVVFDVERSRGELHPVATRPVVDLAPVRCDPEDPARGTRRLRHLLEAIPGGIDGRIVRIRLEGDLGVPEEGVEPGLLEGVRRRAAHLEVRLGAGARDRKDGRAPPGRRAGGGGADTPTGTVGRPAEGRPEAGPSLLAPGLYFVPDAGGSSPGRTVERLAALPPFPGEPGSDAARLRLLRIGGPPAVLLRAARELLSEGRSAEDPGPNADARPPRPDAAPYPRLEAELRARRGDAVEAAGEVEAGTFEWARDRQEAETRLLAYRERARELQHRLRSLEAEDAPCPTCGRGLGEVRDPLRAALGEEWEMVVQDGRWWKRRREQLDERPEALLELEAHSRRLRAEVAALSEALERARSGTPEGAPAGSREPPDAPVAPFRPSAAFRAFLARAGSHLRYWSEGRLSGIRWTGEGAPRVVERGLERAPSADEERALALVLHLALGEERNGGLLVLSGLDERGIDPLLPLLEGAPARDAAVVVVLPPSAPLPATPGLLVLQAVEGEAAVGFRVGPPRRGAIRLSPSR
jgi:hypothetical protein